MIHPGVQKSVLLANPTGAGLTSVDFIVQSSGVLLTLTVPAVSGSLLVQVFAVAGVNELLLGAFAPVTAPTGLVLLSVPTTTASVRVKATYSGACQFEVQARAVEAQATSSGGVSDANPAKYSVQLDDVGGGVTYIGEATPGTATSSPTWRISRLVETGPDLQVLYAQGAASFTNTWDDRTSLSYS